MKKKKNSSFFDMPETIQNIESVYLAVVWFYTLHTSSCQIAINEHPEKQASKVQPHGQDQQGQQR